jgi:hypothetical protein
MQQKYNNKDVVFVFLACRCSEYSWKATISEHQLTGKHYLLNDKQYAGLSEYFNFTGIPHYILIDKKGVVVKDNAPGPGNGEILEELINDLLQHER